MTAAPDPSALASWLCTYALHSTIVLGAAWVSATAMGRRAVASQERILRFALWAALVSSSLQFVVLGGPWPARLSLTATPDLGLVADGAEVATMAPAAAFVADPRRVAAGLPWSTMAITTAGSFAAIGLAWLWSVHRRLARVLSERQPEVDPRVLATAAQVARELRLRQSPRVSRCAGLGTPIAFGWIRPEICLPVRAGDLGDASLRAMLAHEIAHLRRGDPAWMWLAALLQALFPWQLLFVAVRRRWSRLVELRCDAVAARHSSPTAVARCLLDVADWLRSDARAPGIALGMAARPSSLRERVEAALLPPRAEPSRRCLSAAFGGLSLSVLTLAAPGLSPGAPALDVPPAPVDQRQPADGILARSAMPVTAAARSLQNDHRALVEEALQLQRDLASRPPSPELEQLLSTLQRRLLVLERLSARMSARLDRRTSEVR